MVGDEFDLPTDNEKIEKFSEVFDRLCPIYMAMGCTYEDYWNGDPLIAKYTKESYKLKMKTQNSILWLQGKYIYDALIDVFPLFNSMAKDHKPYPYHSNPIPLTKEEQKRAEEENAKAQMEKNMIYMERQLAKSMRMQKKKEDKEDGNRTAGN